MNYSDEERSANYVRLVNTIAHVQNGKRITEDWMEEHMCVIRLYRDFWSDMSRINPDIRDRSFRAEAIEAETLLSRLFTEICHSRTFSVDVYHAFNQKMFKMAQTFLDDEEMADIFAKSLKF